MKLLTLLLIVFTITVSMFIGFNSPKVNAVNSIKMPFNSGQRVLVTQTCTDNLSSSSCIHSGYIQKKYAVDFDCYADSYDILAVSDGQVIEAGVFSGWGNYVKTKHSDGRVALYGHLANFPTVSGFVKQGQKIGNCGSTGNSSGRHLHLEIRPNEDSFSTLPILFDECVGNSNCLNGQMIEMRYYTSRNTNSGSINSNSNNNCKSLYNQSYFVGQTGENISFLQGCLINAGLLNISAPTGYFGNLSKAAIVNVNQIINPPTNCLVSFNGKYSFAQTDATVSTLQSCLIKSGLLNISAPTGYFGNLTSSAFEKMKTIRS